MQEASGLIQDSSGNGNHATAATGTAVYSQPGPIASETSDKAILFDNDPTYFDIPDHATLDVGDVFTWEAWVKRTVTGPSSWEVIAHKGANSGAMGFNGDRLFLSKVTSFILVESTITITDTTNWHHYVATKNGSAVRLYIDSVPVHNTLTTGETCVSTALSLQVGTEGGFLVLQGGLDELAYYGTALSQDRVRAHYEAAQVSGGSLQSDRLRKLGRRIS